MTSTRTQTKTPNSASSPSSKSSSIRRFLVIILIATITLFNFIAALQGYRYGLEKAEKLFDDQLSDMSLLLASNKTHEKEIITTNSKNEIAFQIWNDSSVLTQRSDNAPEQLITPLIAGFNFANFNGYRWRTFVAQDKNNNVWIITAERTDRRYILAEQVILTTILPIIIALPIIGFLIWIIIGKGLQPLENLAKKLYEKKSHDLSPLENDNVPLELEQLVISTNALLKRLSDSFEREKRFSGDAAHELRTPLSVIKIQLFNLQNAMPEKTKELNMINRSVDRMTHLIEQMLTLYRTTPDQFLAKFQSLDLFHIAQNVIAEEYPKIEAKHQQISLDGNTSLMVGDSFALQTLVKNLIDNANKYTPEHGEILVSVSEINDHILLSVSDSGVGIPEHLYERALERFYRVNGDQHNSNTTGSGLGLAIVKHIVDLHHGSIKLKPSAFKSGLTVEVLLPKNQDSTHET